MMNKKIHSSLSIKKRKIRLLNLYRGFGIVGFSVFSAFYVEPQNLVTLHGIVGAFRLRSMSTLRMEFVSKYDFLIISLGMEMIYENRALHRAKRATT